MILHKLRRAFFLLVAILAALEFGGLRLSEAPPEPPAVLSEPVPAPSARSTAPPLAKRLGQQSAAPAQHSEREESQQPGTPTAAGRNDDLQQPDVGGATRRLFDANREGFAQAIETRVSIGGVLAKTRDDFVCVSLDYWPSGKSCRGDGALHRLMRTRRTLLTTLDRGFFGVPLRSVPR